MKGEKSEVVRRLWAENQGADPEHIQGLYAAIDENGVSLATVRRVKSMMNGTNNGSMSGDVTGDQLVEVSVAVAQAGGRDKVVEAVSLVEELSATAGGSIARLKECLKKLGQIKV